MDIWPVVVALNHNNENLANKQVRQALMMAVDQEAIIDAVWGRPLDLGARRAYVDLVRVHAHVLADHRIDDRARGGAAA